MSEFKPGDAVRGRYSGVKKTVVAVDGGYAWVRHSDGQNEVTQTLHLVPVGWEQGKTYRLKGIRVPEVFVTHVFDNGAAVSTWKNTAGEWTAGIQSAASYSLYEEVEGRKAP